MEYANKVQKRKNIRLEAKFALHNWWGDMSEEYLIRKHEERAKDFNEFIRDHRSQDDVRLETVWDNVDVCSECGREWEVAIEDSVKSCAWCGAEVTDTRA